MAERQERLGMDEASAAPEGLARLIDRLQQRLGAGAVCQLHPHQKLRFPSAQSVPFPPLPVFHVMPKACFQHDERVGVNGERGQLRARC